MKLLIGRGYPIPKSKWTGSPLLSILVPVLLILILFLPSLASAHTYTLETNGCSGGPYSDNSLFSIVGDQLKTAASFDYETKPSCTICIRTTDDGGSTFDKEFTISINNVDEIPVVSTNAATSISTTSATGNGDITDLGGPNPTSHGVCWGLSSNPTTADSSTDNGGASATGTFTSAMTSLAPGTSYHYRAYATNTVGTAYGTDKTFTTLNSPTVTTQAATSVGQASATGNGNITNLGVPNPTQHGVCWSTSANPTTSDNCTTRGAAGSTGAFTSSITGLTSGTLYHYRAYATNVVATAYGADTTFTTLKLSTVTTQAATGVGTTTATGNGDITDLGSPDPTQHGVCWSTAADPTTSDSKTEDGAASATGSFTSLITGLNPGVEYHYRAYATNAAGTSYGADMTFTTTPVAPTVTTEAASTVGTTSATGNGTISDLGAPNPTQHGVCWSTSANPTTSDTCTTKGAASATGAFTSDMTGLTPGTVYHYRAYATNTADTSYGADQSFSTLAPDLTVTEANDAGGSVLLGNNWTWTVSILNTGNGDAVFTDGQVILSDQLPDSNVNYGAASLSNISGIVNQGNISAVISGNVLTVSASGGTVTIGASTGGFDVGFTATPTSAGTFSNPRSGGSCKVDPYAAVTESNEGNNTPSADTVTVTAPDLTVTKTNNKSGSIQLGENWTWSVSIRNTGDADASFTGSQVILTDNLPDTAITYALLSTYRTNITNITGDANILAAIAGNTLTVSASGGSVVLGANTGRFDIEFTATPSAEGTYVNPRSGGSCKVDPNTLITENNETNNTGTDTVTVATPEIGVKQGGSPIADTGSHDFGSQVVGSITDVVFTIENTGSGDLTLTTPVTIGGTDANQFSIQAQPVSPVADSGSTTFTVRFSPTSSGAKTATVAIANNDSDENPYDLTFNGTGTEPEIVVQGNGSEILDGDSTPAETDFTDFGDVDINSGTKSRTFTIKNNGTADLTLSGTPMVAVSGAHSGDFTVTAQPSSGTVAASGSTTFTVQFDPSATGERNAEISIANDDADENPYNFSITGNGTGPEINIKQGTTDIADGGNYNFSSQGIGSDTDAVFTIENTGNADLTVSTSISVSGTDADQFSIQAQPASPIAGSGTTTFTVRFSPTTSGAKTATLSITTNDGDENPYDLTLNGTGTSTEISLKQGTTDIADGGSYDFGVQEVDTDTDIVFTIENTGNADLTVNTTLAIEGDNADQFSIQAQPVSPVAGSGSTTFTVRFRPASAGAKTASISITNNDDDENPYDLVLNGSGDDNDGVDDAIEDGVPGPGGVTGDGNGDGELDSCQDNVTSLLTDDNANYATLDCKDTAGTTLENVSASSASEAGVPPEINMPYGVFSFEVQGVTGGQIVAMDIFVSRDESITGYFKENKNTGVWEDVAIAVDHASVEGKTRITIRLAEGGPYDMDSISSMITDPGGPGSQASEAIPTLNEWGMVILSFLIVLGSMMIMGNRERFTRKNG